MARHYYSGVALDTTLSGALSAVSGSGTITVPESGSDNGWPASFPFYLGVDAGTLAEEVVEVTAKGALSGSTRTWVVNRAANGLVSSHATGAAVRHLFSSMDADDASDHANNDGSDYAEHNKLPRGVLVRTNAWSGGSTPTNGAETAMGWSNSASPGGALQVVSGRLYRLTLYFKLKRSDSIEDLGQIWIRLGNGTGTLNAPGTVLFNEFFHLAATLVGDGPYLAQRFFKGGGTTVLSSSTNVLHQVAAGGQYFVWSVAKNSGSGNAATMSMPWCEFAVEDCGTVI